MDEKFPTKTALGYWLVVCEETLMALFFSLIDDSKNVHKSFSKL